LVSPLNVVFLSFVQIVVAYFSGLAYLSTGVRTMKYLGTGFLVYALGALMFVGFTSYGSSVYLIDAAVTTSNLGIVVASGFQFIGATYTVRGATTIRSGRRWRLSSLYLGAVLYIALVTAWALLDPQPYFFVEGQGSTPLRTIVLGVSIGLFALSGLFVLRVWAGGGSSVLYWYSLALMLYAIGLSAFFLQRNIAGPIGWAGRLAQYVAGVYVLIGLFTARSKSGNPSL
jgi:hypothetical protein